MIINYELLIPTSLALVLISTIFYLTLKKRKRSATSIYKLIDNFWEKNIY